MEYLRVVLYSVGSIIVLFILTKIVGNRQMSQLSMFDYIVGITIGSIAAEMATSLEENFMQPLIAMIIYAVLNVLISIGNYKSLKMRRFFSGKPVILYQDGVLYKKNLKKTKLDISEFLGLCRNNGYFNLSDLQVALLETNGKISFLPSSLKRPVTPEDLNLSPKQSRPLANVIIDGNLQLKNLKNIGKDEEWLRTQLKAQKIDDPCEVFLATCDEDNNLSVYIKMNIKYDKDIFE